MRTKTLLLAAALALTGCTRAVAADPTAGHPGATAPPGVVATAAPGAPASPPAPAPVAPAAPAPEAAAPVPTAAASPLGINLYKIRPYAPEIVFVDVLRASRRWRVRPPEPGLVLDENDWPRRLAVGQTAELEVLTGFATIPQGTWVCLYEGTGTLEFEGADVVGSGPGRFELRLRPGGYRAVRIVATDPADPIRNVRLFLPGYADAASPFHPRFLELWRGFSPLRFMDWGETNHSEVRTWADRPVPGGFQGTDDGVALELMVELANELGADPWICIPHLADDDYVRRAAALVKERLDPRLRVWIEYSNEVWNGQFAQARHARERGMALGLGHRDRLAAQRYVSRRSVEIFRIFEAAFGGTDRLVRVIAGQYSTPNGIDELLGFEGAARHTDAYAIAPYFGGRLVRKQGEEVLAMGMDGLMAALREELPSHVPRIRENVERAGGYGVPVVAYEGGQHLRGSPRVEGLNDLLIRANRTFMMGELYGLYLDHWREAGGHTFVHFSSTSTPGDTGSWGALESFDQDERLVPKYQALRTFAAENPKWWGAGP